ncbi:hypothetical protein [Moraxella marmotae]|uniref:hypothetical protein n=1 Tax=Moraxella marmotae TaxID=3344520 RepID=UPI00366EA743
MQTTRFPCLRYAAATERMEILKLSKVSFSCSALANFSKILVSIIAGCRQNQ